MNPKNIDPLDQALGKLPRDVRPERDLWAGIAAGIAQEPVATVAPARREASMPWMRMAAGVALVIASSLITYLLTQQAAQNQALEVAQTQMREAPVVPVMPASFGGQDAMGAEYLRARAALDAEFQRQIATLPPVTRAKLERNLADLRRAASEISATLAEHPSHPLLQELLLSTYQSELALLGSVTEMAVPVLTPPNETRL